MMQGESQSFLCGCGCGAVMRPKWNGSKIFRRFAAGHQHPNSKLSWRERFDQHVYPDPNSGCHLFVGKSTTDGYGLFRHEGKIKMAHRFALELEGRPPLPSECVLHRCDTECCVNPSHLFIGSRTENNRDRTVKYRGRKGSGMFPYGVSQQRGRFKAQFCPPRKGRTQGLGRYDTVEQATAVARYCKEVAFGMRGVI